MKNSMHIKVYDCIVLKWSNAKNVSTPHLYFGYLYAATVLVQCLLTAWYSRRKLEEQEDILDSYTWIKEHIRFSLHHNIIPSVWRILHNGVWPLSKSQRKWQALTHELRSRDPSDSPICSYKLLSAHLFIGPYQKMSCTQIHNL